MIRYESDTGMIYFFTEVESLSDMHIRLVKKGIMENVNQCEMLCFMMTHEAMLGATTLVAKCDEDFIRIYGSIL